MMTIVMVMMMTTVDFDVIRILNIVDGDIKEDDDWRQNKTLQG